MGISLERCAGMRAEMDAGRQRDQVLARAGVSVEEWTASQREWLDKMGVEISLGRFELTNRYTQAFLERQREVAAPPAVAVTAPPAVQGTLPPPAPPPPLVGAVAPDLVLPPPAAPPPRAPDAPSPWVEAAGSRAVLPTPVPPEDSTGLPMPSPLRGPLPFQPAPAPALVASAPAPRPPAASPSAKLDATTAGAISPFAALPFAPAPAASTAGVPTARPLPAAAPPPLPAGRPPPLPSTPGKLDATTMGALSPLAGSLPFMTKGPPVAPPPPVAPAAVAAPAAAPAPQPAPALTAPATVGGLTLEQHASLCAELAHAPQRADEVLSRYRATKDGKVEMDQAWKARFAADPSLERKWHEAYRLYFAFLSSARR